MKLATWKDGSRDGQLVVVSPDLGVAHYASGIAATLQQALQDWAFYAPQLQDLSDALRQGRAPHAFPFEAAMCMAPLPRSYQWMYGAVQAVDAPRPRMEQGNGGGLMSGTETVLLPDAETGADFGAGLSVITGDIAAGAAPEQALEGVRLVVMHNHWRFHREAAGEEAVRDATEAFCPLVGSVFGPVVGTAFSPVAVTPDELGAAWQHGRLKLVQQNSVNGRRNGLCDMAAGMPWHFGELLAQATRWQALRAGAVVGSGVINAVDAAKGYGCMASRRSVALRDGEKVPPYLRDGDAFLCEVRGADGGPVFGAIAQGVALSGKAQAAG